MVEELNHNQQVATTQGGDGDHNQIDTVQLALLHDMPQFIDGNLELMKQLGVGGFAEVYLYGNQLKQVAIKIQKKEDPAAKKKMIMSGFSSEAYTMRQLHKRIATLNMLKRIPEFYGDTYINNR